MKKERGREYIVYCLIYKSAGWEIVGKVIEKIVFGYSSRDEIVMGFFCEKIEGLVCIN